MAKKRKPKGQRGSWTAKVGGEILPVLHRDLMIEGGTAYVDGFEIPHSIAKRNDFIDRLERSNRCIVAASQRQPNGTFKLTGDWVGLYEFQSVDFNPKTEHLEIAGLEMVERFA